MVRLCVNDHDLSSSLLEDSKGLRSGVPCGPQASHTLLQLLQQLLSDSVPQRQTCLQTTLVK